MDSTPLMDRLRAAEQRNVRPLRPAEPVPFVPAWRRRMQTSEADRFLARQDTTDLVLGSWIRPKDGSAA
jgi:hypothetical protein